MRGLKIYRMGYLASFELEQLEVLQQEGQQEGQQEELMQGAQQEASFAGRASAAFVASAADASGASVGVAAAASGASDAASGASAVASGASAGVAAAAASVAASEPFVGVAVAASEPFAENACAADAAFGEFDYLAASFVRPALAVSVAFAAKLLMSGLVCGRGGSVWLQSGYAHCSGYQSEKALDKLVAVAEG